MYNTVDIQGLAKSFGKKQAVLPLQFRLAPGTVVGLAGDNGAGKSTLLRMLADVIKPTAGGAWVVGTPVGADTHQYVSYMPDASNLYPWMKVGQIIRWHADMFSDFSEQEALRLCAVTGLDPGAKIRTLSKGYTERVMLVLTLARNVPLYLLDEPLAGADPLSKQLLKAVILEKRGPDRTILVSTHLLYDMEALFDEVLFMARGTIVQRTPAAEIRAGGLPMDQYYVEVMCRCAF